MTRDPELPHGYQDADLEMAELEAVGRSHDAQRRISEQATDPGIRARLCPHGWGYQTPSEAATEAADPMRDRRGFRCHYCGGWFPEDWPKRGAVPEHIQEVTR